MESRPTQSFTKGSESEEEEKLFIQGEASNDEVHSKKGATLKDNESLGMITVKQI